LQSANAAEKYVRKSISFINEIFLISSEAQIPEDKAPVLMTGLQKEIEMPRFDYNELPESFRGNFSGRWEEWQKNSSPAIQRLDALRKEISQTEQSIEEIKQRIKELDDLIDDAISTDNIQEKARALEYREKKKEYQKELKSLLEQRDKQLAQQKAEEDALFQEAAELLTETVAPPLMKVLTDPEVLEFRAKRYVDEVERQRFIVIKAKELGITSGDLEKVIHSAYIYMIILTDYSRTDYSKMKVGIAKDRVEYRVSGGVIWFKLVVSEEKSEVQVLKTIRTDASAVGTPELDASTFQQAINQFARNLGLATKEMSDFILIAAIVDSIGSKVGFSLGKQDDLYIGQKFRVYEKQKRGNEIKMQKKGFFYVSKIGDQTSEGKMVIGQGEPGMPISEFPNTGIDLNFCFRTGSIKLEPSSSESPDSGLDIEKEVKAPLQAFNCTLQYDLGRYLEIPQLFATIGGEIGLEQIGLTSNVDKEAYVEIYYGGHLGFLKKHYINRIALYVEPLFQFHWLSIGVTNGERSDIENKAISFAPKIGAEFAIREDLNVGLALNLKLLNIIKDDIGNLYPRALFGVYLGYSLGRYW
jgi:cell division protein FtsB